MPTSTKCHDLQLPDWGPYSPCYAGTSHLSDPQQGLRFDLSVMPGYFRQSMIVPNERYASGHHAWEAAADLSHYAFRYEIEWKDQVYCDVSYTALEKNARLIRCQFVNNTELFQNLKMHLVANMNFPPRGTDPNGVHQVDNIIELARVSVPEGGVWIDALDYQDLNYAVARPTDSLVEDGFFRGEIRDNGLVNGNAIGCGFGRDTGDRVMFRIRLENSISDAALLFRFRLPDNNPAAFSVQGMAETELSLSEDYIAGDGMGQVALNVGDLSAGEHEVILTSLGTAPIELDGFAITPADEADKVEFTPHQWSHTPEISERIGNNSLILKYADSDNYYGIAWDHPDVWLREFLTDHLDTTMRNVVPNNYTGYIDTEGTRHYTDVFLGPIEVKPHTQRIHYAITCSGTREEVETALTQFEQQSSDALESVYSIARRKVVHLDSLPSGETYRFSQERMAATELLNVIYPIYTRKQFVRYFCPGKWWETLYTWDAGFIGLALLEYDTALSLDNLETALTNAGDEHAAFINHGTLIPTQIYQFHELWNRTQDRAMLASIYPRLRQYYLFLAGRWGSSTTRDMASNLIRTWNIFRWDSGGWDDYPAQLHTIHNDLDSKVACAALTAHVIRAAKIMLSAAESLDIAEDVGGYTEDIEVLTNALQQHAWDKEAGYFSYVVHDDKGAPKEFLRDENGVNFNMGLDGVMPLFAGACTSEQAALFLDRLADPKHFWTRIGLSTVDQSAPYYRTDGYWNGAVWMPHQWFIWKTALDLGQGDFAYQIARTALDLWKAEVEASYYCFEHFLIQSGRGAGWHQFGALSSPVVSWFSAYHCPGRISTGMDIWIEAQSFSDDFSSFEGNLRLTTALKTVTVIVNLQPSKEYCVQWNGKAIDYKEINPGSLQIDLSFESSIGELKINILPTGRE
ncbi:hypothetical protein HBA55_01525 [Pseudomaricurvus alkylphenolicus]|uniref:MGH1-like glycoside hydrolase domain-containing protein n=1 Tax=Pseudomaricurvus alkylphenolicus TaxID=1306991 RepID=UPI00141F2DB0|nr:trehalase family glycosidase [Pseudomaricurvus alkylphenolicus]NIB38243.1 hypothetical protein [Pseudomaricurvus alkylphenolicus]